MTNPYRSLCAELLGELQALRRAVADEIGCPSPEPSVVLRARATLAQPEPVAPTDKDLYDLWNSEGIEADFQDCRRFARAYAARWGTPTIEPAWPPMPVPGDAEGLAEVFWGRYDQPEPVAPTDEEILASVRHFYGDQTAADMGAEDDLRTARAAIAADRARWGTPTNNTGGI